MSAGSLMFVVGILVFSAQVWLLLSGRRERAWIALAAGSAVGFAMVLVQWWRTGHLPVTNMYYSMIFLASSTMGAAAWAGRMDGGRSPSVAALGAAFVALSLGWATRFFVPRGMPFLVPALQSPLMPAHVAFAFVGEACFIVAALYGAAILVREDWKADELAALRRTMRKVALFGFCFFTCGALVLGMLWAAFAWGRYWGWDPKEVWSLITFLVLAIYFHLERRGDPRDRRGEWVLVLGGAVTLFTLFGVNLLLSGLHSYGG